MLDWPPQSPDLNPIEQVWAIIKAQLYTMESYPKNAAELIDCVLAIWNSLQPQLAQSLVDSLPKRMESVVLAKGKWVKNKDFFRAKFRVGQTGWDRLNVEFSSL